MRVPLSWIRDFAPITGDTPSLAQSMDELGLVVEDIIEIGEGLQDVVVARVEEIGAIDGADRIRRVVVQAGNGPVEIVCGAWNFSVGDLVPLAPVGAVLPGGFEITRRKMKGVVSNGMLCSPRELELADDHLGILVLDGSPEPGTPLMDALGIERDIVFDISVDANRPDAWSMAGVARDLAARLKIPFAIPQPPDPANWSAAGSGAAVTDIASVEVVDRDLCPRFTARVLTDVVIGPSPGWLARRLTLAGMRPINNVVDASNYVMLELGQPTHPYDLDRLPGGALRIRASRPGETLVTLDGMERRFGEHSVGGGDDLRDCLICDADDHPVGIGGIMGGSSSEIADETSRVLLEAAYFAPMAVARTSKRLGLRTEASARFERGCDPMGIDRATARLIELLGLGRRPVVSAGGPIDVRGEVPQPLRLALRTTRVNSLLGTALGSEEVAGILTPLGFEVKGAAAASHVLDVTVPTYRPDTQREIDLIEEVARHYGYGNIPRRRPQAPQVGALTTHQRRRRALREIMAGTGAHEAWTNSLLAPGDHERCGRSGGVTLSNPLTPDEAVLRRTMLPGLLRALAFNFDRRQVDLRLFEIGHVFPPPDDERVAAALAGTGATVIDEREMLAVALAGQGDDALTAARTWHLLEESLGVQGVELRNDSEGHPDTAGLHPTRRAILVDGQGAIVGVVGEVDPLVLDAFGIDAAAWRVGWIELDLVLLFGAVPEAPKLAKAVSRYPSSDIDLAFVTDDGVPAAAVRHTLRSSGGDLLESVVLFDVYRGTGTPPGTRSLAYRLRFCAPDHTLTDDEVAALRRTCIEAVTAQHGATLRG